MKKMAAVAFVLAASISLTACDGAIQSDMQFETEEESQTSTARDLALKGMAAISVCEDYLNGDLTYELALGVLEDYEEEADDLSDAASDGGIYTSVDLYIGQMRATLSSWDKLEIVGDDPEAMLKVLMEELEEEADGLYSES